MIILNTKTGQTYSTIAEAARKTGASASGISRVVTGQRQSAGGYGWARIETPAAAAPLVKAAAAAERRQKRESPARYERTKAARAKSRKKATQTRHKEAAKAKQAQKAAAAAPAKPKRKRATPETMIKRADTLEKIKQLNTLRQKLKTKFDEYGLESTKQDIQRIDLLIKTIAGDETAPGGYLRESKRFVSDFSDVQLDNIADEIRGTISEITVLSDTQLAKLYHQYKGTIEKDRLQKYNDAYSDFLEIIGQARELAARTTGDGEYKDIYESVVPSAYRVTDTQLVDITKMIAAKLKETDENGAELPITQEWINEVLKKWESELTKGGSEYGEPPVFQTNWD